MSNNHYARWNAPDMVRAFADKKTGDFFESETRFLAEIMPHVASVLDIGCASGRFLPLLRQWRQDVAYTGIDLSAANIEIARADYPDAAFHHGNALDCDPGGPFDLVNATGVMQHEPRFEDLIGKMLYLSSGHVLFDVKLARIKNHIVDRNIAYAGSAENRLYFNLLSYPLLRAFLRGLAGLSRISVYGYATPLNRRTHVPDGISEIVSANILLVKGDAQSGQAALDETLPDLTP